MPIGCEALENRDAEGSFGAGTLKSQQAVPESFPLKNRMRCIEEFLLYNKGGTANQSPFVRIKGVFFIIKKCIS